MTATREFDLSALFAAVDAQRREQQLGWPGLATAIWQQSRALNERRDDHPISPATIRQLAEGRGLSCQHALFVLRWLGLPPETFIAEPRPGTVGIPLPAADEAHRLRWRLRKLHEVLDAVCTARGATWQQAADDLRCTPGQLIGLRTAKFATGMRLAMRITRALRRPAVDFVYVADW